MKSIKKIGLCFVSLLLFTVSFSSCDTRKFKLPKEELTIIRIDGSTTTVNAEIASKPEERNYGFMNRKKIPEGTGMLFVFEKDQVLHFWMKNTPTPLSIAYLDSRGKVVDVLDMTPYSLANVSSSRSVRYALEVPQGWFAKENVKPGDFVLLPKK